MFVCQECKSTKFEKIDGFLYCLVCQVQQKDYVEYVVEIDPKAETLTLGSQKKSLGKKRLVDRKQRAETENWTAWDAYNYILLGFVKELTETGLAPCELQSTVLSIWMGYVAKSADHGNKFGIKRPKKRKLTKRSVKIKPTLSISRLKKFHYHFMQEKSTNRTLQEGLESLHLGKRRKIDKESMHIDDGEGDLTLSQLSSVSMRQLEKRLMERHYSDYIHSQEGKIDVLAHETIETIGRQPLHDPSMPSTRLPESSLSHLPCLKEVNKPTNEKFRIRKRIPMCKGRALEMIHMALLMCGSDVQLGDLLRFIREAHLSYAKITHYLPPEIKLTRENYGYLETVQKSSMPSHVQLRKLGADIAKVLGIEEFPVPDLSRLIRRYVTELKLPVLITSYATLLCQIADAENLCSFKRAKKRIPNYEGMAAACIIMTLKFLFGLDDQTEFLLSDMAKKTNKLLKQKTKSESAKLFDFQEWKKFIELRRTVLSIVHYPTQEKVDRHPLTTGFLDMLIKESKDPHRAERFESYNQYYIKPELLNICKQMLETLIDPKDEYTMEFPPTLKPQTTYLAATLKDYNERKKAKEPRGTSGCFQFSEISEWAQTLLVKHYEKRQVFYMYKPEEYSQLLRENGYRIRTLSKLDQTQMIGECKTSKKLVELKSDLEYDLHGESDHSDTENGLTMNHDDVMDFSKEKMEFHNGGAEEKKQSDDTVELPPNGKDGLRSKHSLRDGGKNYNTYYMGKPDNTSYRKIKKMPKNKYKGSTWSDICYYKLKSSNRVYIVKDMAVVWKLPSPWLSEECNRYFMLQVFRKTPQNFQWIVRQFASMLEMKVREVYLECYRLEVALDKARRLVISRSPTKASI